MIIGITGKKRAGKDTAAEYLTSIGFVLYRFADPIKRLCADIFLWDDEHINGDYKETVDERWGISPRKAQQLVGTELFREALPGHSRSFNSITGPDVWVRRFGLWYHGQDVVIPDVRFPNEADVIKAMGGHIVRIERPGACTTDPHPSELMMDSIKADYTLTNDGGIDGLQWDMKMLYQKIKGLYPA